MSCDSENVRLLTYERLRNRMVLLLLCAMYFLEKKSHCCRRCSSYSSDLGNYGNTTSCWRLDRSPDFLYKYCMWPLVLLVTFILAAPPYSGINLEACNDRYYTKILLFPRIGAGDTDSTQFVAQLTYYWVQLPSIEIENIFAHVQGRFQAPGDRPHYVRSDIFTDMPPMPVEFYYEVRNPDGSVSLYSLPGCETVMTDSNGEAVCDISDLGDFLRYYVQANCVTIWAKYKDPFDREDGEIGYAPSEASRKVCRTFLLKHKYERLLRRERHIR
jgi:hypothetical protein